MVFHYFENHICVKRELYRGEAVDQTIISFENYFDYRKDYIYVKYLGGQR